VKNGVNGMDAYYYFKLKHNIQNDSELKLGQLEAEKFMEKPLKEIKNFIDVISEEPLRDFIAKEGIRPQDYITRLLYPGRIQGYWVKNTVKDCTGMIARLTYFREFYVLVNSDDSSIMKKLFPLLSMGKIEFSKEVKFYDLLPYVQLFTVIKETPKMLFRFIPLHTLYEASDFICRLAKKPEHVDRMFEESIRHIRSEIYWPFSPSSARWYKKIGDFIDNREAPQLYLTHYIFGIRGKFFPRMIGAIMNAAGVNKGDWILDPFCGCGTMNVEAAIRGVNSIGIDMQPLFTIITDLKVKSMKWDVQWLRKYIERLLHEISLNFECDDKSKILSYITTKKISDVYLPNSLMKGIRKDSLNVVKVIKGCINQIGEDIDDDSLRKDLQNFCKLPLAYWMRSMLKKQNPSKILQTYKDYLWSMFFSIQYFHRFKKEIYNFEIGEAKVATNDVRDLLNVENREIREILERGVDGIITSPPYGTAIDYIGEHVWALYVLDLVKNHLKLDKEKHIGTPRVEKSLVIHIKERSSDFKSLPAIAQETLTKMVKNGREKKAAAFYKYFVDMRDAFEQMTNVLKPGKHLIMIIGKQQVVAGEKEKIVIELGRIMEELGKKFKLKHLSSIDVELQKASERGAIPTEHIIIFKK